MKPILEVQNISKKYVLGRKTETYKTLRDSILLFNKPAKVEEEFWALQDLSFDLYPGDSLAIIGKNGAGKSTLLKILSKITPPTKGKIICRGRIASLLEVGTGFHGELSGRENIFLNGSILGMKRKEIEARYDEIVDFSGVEKFIDTALKHYSSGMQLRLAFAVAAFLDPEILIVDEVLAVGDMEFQKKCLGKMQDVSSQGKTTIFVSHNLLALQSICKTGLLLSEGRKISSGPIEQELMNYANLFRRDSEFFSCTQYKLTDRLSIESFSLSPASAQTGDDIDFELILNAGTPVNIYDLSILFYNKFDMRIAIVDLRKNGENMHFGDVKNTLSVHGRIHAIPLIESEYKIGLFVNSNVVNKNFLSLFYFSLSCKSNTGQKIKYPSEARGVVELDISTIEYTEQ